MREVHILQKPEDVLHKGVQDELDRLLTSESCNIDDAGERQVIQPGEPVPQEEGSTITFCARCFPGDPGELPKEESNATSGL